MDATGSADKTVIVTGGNSGLGFETAQGDLEARARLARHHCRT